MPYGKHWRERQTRQFNKGNPEVEREKKTPFHSVVWQQSPRVPFQVETPPPRDLAAQGSWSAKNDRNKVADAGKFRSMSRAGAALEPRWCRAGAALEPLTAALAG